MFLFPHGRCLEVWGEADWVGICLRIISSWISMQTRAGFTILTMMPDDSLSDPVPRATWGNMGTAMPPSLSC